MVRFNMLKSNIKSLTRLMCRWLQECCVQWRSSGPEMEGAGVEYTFHEYNERHNTAFVPTDFP